MNGGAGARRAIAPQAVRRVAVIGAECVGKSTLCAALADALPGCWIPEYLREFCAERGRPPHRNEQTQLFAVQIEREAAAVERAAADGLAWVLCDSAPLLTAIFSIHYFDDDSLLGPALAHHPRYAATLLLRPDLPWVADGIQRDGEPVRAAVDALIIAQLAAGGVLARPVAGQGPRRVAAALAALRELAAPPAVSDARSTPRGTLR